MKKLLINLALFVLVGALAVVFLPLFYLMAWMLFVVLPPICAVVTIQDARAEGERILSAKVLGKLFLAVLVVPVGILAIAAPLRVLVLAPMSFFPHAMAAFHEIHALIYDPFLPVFGALFPYWLDVFWGIVSLLFFFFIALGDSIRRNRLVRQLEILPTAKIRSVAVGLAELKGRAIALADRDRKQPIMRSWIESTDDGVTSRSHIDPFYLDDGSGLILVDPRGATINDEGDYFGVSLHQAILSQIQRKRGFPESRMMPGDPVYVVGNVQINRDRSEFPDEAVIVKPRKSSWLSMNFFDLFLVSNIGEQALITGFRKSVKRGWRNVLICMAFGAWLTMYGVTNLIQIQSTSIEAAPEYLRLVATPTELERVISVGSLGERPTIDFVRMLEDGDAKKTKAIMRRLRELHLDRLAYPVLRKQAVDIDHPGFGIANHWLGRLRKSLPGHWGTELFSAHYIRESEAVMHRLLTRYEDNRLYVSYRAYIGNKRRKEGDTIERRSIVIALTRPETGDELRARYDADFGWNRADNVLAFEYLEPGDYELLAHPETAYGSGFYNRGSRTPSAVNISLED